MRAPSDEETAAVMVVMGLARNLFATEGDRGRALIGRGGEEQEIEWIVKGIKGTEEGVSVEYSLRVVMPL